MDMLVPRANLASKDARRRLRVREAPYWNIKEWGQSLGYHKCSSKRSYWVARFRTKGASYRRRRLGQADDWAASDGHLVLSHAQAWDLARRWFAEPLQKSRASTADQTRVGACDELCVCPVGDVFTIGHALHDYAEWKRLAAAKSNFAVLVSLMNYHILPRLAPIPVEDFNVETARRFMRDVLESPPKRGLQPVGPRRSIEMLEDEELRKRKKTVNTLLSILRVALQMAWENGKVEDERAWRLLRRFPNVDRVRALHLSRAECKSLLESCRPDLRRLVLAALYTGCRATELLRMRCSDVGRDGYGVYVVPSKLYKPRFVFLPDEGMAWFLSIAQGREPGEYLFLNDRTQRRFVRYKHVFKQAVLDARLPSGFSFHGLRHTYASQLIQAGASVYAVADQLGHADPVTVLKTYGHLSPQIRESEVRQRFTTLSDTNRRLASRKRSELRVWRNGLHGSEWRTYAKINDLSARRNVH